MIYTTINTKNMDEADVVIVSAPYEKTVSSGGGTANGPKRIIDCLDYKLEFFDRKLKCETNKILKTAHRNIKDINKLKPEKALQKIEKEYAEILEKNKFPILLGGEHSVSLGALKVLAEKINSKDVTIVQFDAHCDLRDNDSDYPSAKVSNLAHSCVMRRVSELGYNLVQVGIRTYSIIEHEYFSDPQNNVKVFEWGLGHTPTIEEILNSISTKYVYLSIDADGFDPSYMPATGTPVQGGIEWWYGIELIERLIAQKELLGADIVEVAPIKDSVLTEYGAAQLIYTIMTNKFKDRLTK